MLSRIVHACMELCTGNPTPFPGVGANASSHGILRGPEPGRPPDIQGKLTNPSAETRFSRCRGRSARGNHESLPRMADQWRRGVVGEDVSPYKNEHGLLHPNLGSPRKRFG